MTKAQVKSVTNVLQAQLVVSDQMWENKESHAKIVGYLQGVIKGVIGEMENFS